MKIIERKIFIGTSGYSYDEWKDVFYPKSIKSDEMFEYYTQKFDTVEINSSFYQIPSAKTVEEWNKKSPKWFRFSAKIPNLVTHKSLLDPEEFKQPLDIFLQNMTPLFQNEKTLALLLQLPPKFNYEDHKARLEYFLSFWNSKIDGLIEQSEILKRGVPNLVVEFRNNDWLKEDTFDMLKNYNASFCTVVEPLLPPIIKITSTIFYMRFHGFGQKIWFDYLFSEHEIDEWKPKILDLSPKVGKVILYFNNHFSGNAVKNADYMKKILEISNPKNTSGLDRFL
jgi:uncharacterized protein YecE (DUF72 family)